MSSDLVHQLKVVQDISPGAALTSFAAGPAHDTKAYESLTFTINVGTMAFTGTDKLTWTVEESDTTTSGDFAAVAAEDYIGAYKDGVSGWDRIMDATGDDVGCYTIGVRLNNKRYKRLVPTEGGTVSVVISSAAILAHGRHQPQ